MNILVNGVRQEYPPVPLTVSKLIELNKVESPDMVSVQLNGEFVERGNFHAAQLKDGDTVEFLYFMGGGADERIYY